jgi:hypothetical protein
VAVVWAGKNPLLEQFPDRWRAVKEFEPFSHIFTPEQLSVLHLAVSWLGCVIFDASCWVDRKNLLQCYPKYLPELVYAIRVIALPELRMEGIEFARLNWPTSLI